MEPSFDSEMGCIWWNYGRDWRDRGQYLSATQPQVAQTDGAVDSDSGAREWITPRRTSGLSIKQSRRAGHRHIVELQQTLHGPDRDHQRNSVLKDEKILP